MSATADSAPSEAEVVRVVILGAGSSSSTPKMDCIVSESPCKACKDACADPKNSRNHRLNPSLLIQVRSVHESDCGAESPKEGSSAQLVPLDQCSVPYSVHTQPEKAAPHQKANQSTYLNILIDCGKTFRECALRQFPALGIRTLHAIMITHDHADAAFGVDDLREFTKGVKAPMPVYVDTRTDSTMRRVFGYLYPTTAATDGRWVASLDWVTFEQGSDVPVRVRGLSSKQPVYASHDDRPVNAAPSMQDAVFPVTSFPIEHGPDYMSNGFIFELFKGHVLVYFSDISRFDKTDAERLKAVVGDRVIEVLILDMLSTMPYFSHFSRNQALECAGKIEAKHTYFVGMSHTLEYAECNAKVKESLRKAGLEGELGYDGCVVFDAFNGTNANTDTAEK